MAALSSPTPVGRLPQDEESRLRGCEAGRRGGLGTLTDLLLLYGAGTPPLSFPPLGFRANSYHCSAKARTPNPIAASNVMQAMVSHIVQRLHGGTVNLPIRLTTRSGGRSAGSRAGRLC